LSLSEITHRLQVEGVKLFADSFNQLLNAIEQKRQQLQGAAPQTPTP
ncbi:MAG: hypothetical protein HY318_20390, partial [Armatimonadetes bacterium]|nr:hypothetical protein [Armatimonadota bacterium]